MSCSAPADQQRRLHAFVLDQGVALALAATAVGVATASGGGGGAAVLSGGFTAVVVTTLLGAGAGLTGASPGRLAAGVRLGDVVEVRPPGMGRGAARALVLALVGWTTAGVGWLAMALSVSRDPDGQGRGWHDRLLGTRVGAIPVRPDSASSAQPRPEVASASDTAAGGVVDLTALRLQQPPTVATARAASARVLPQRWQVAVDDGVVRDVADRMRWGGVEFARVEGGALVLRDLGSAQGTLLVRGGAARTVEPGRVATLLPGDRVRVGQRWAWVHPHG